MNTLSALARRALKAQAHHLHPVASIGQHGLTEGVLREIEVALCAHELIKVRAYTDDRALRAAWMSEICEKTGAFPVQSIGKLFVVWRERPKAEAVPVERSAARNDTAARPKTGTHSAKAFAASARRKTLSAQKAVAQRKPRAGGARGAVGFARNTGPVRSVGRSR